MVTLVIALVAVAIATVIAKLVGSGSGITAAGGGGLNGPRNPRSPINQARRRDDAWRHSMINPMNPASPASPLNLNNPMNPTYQARHRPMHIPHRPFR